MKIGIITFHRAENYGAVLQAYALQSYINKYTQSAAQIVDYRCEAIEHTYRASDLYKNKGFKGILRYLARVGNTKRRNKIFRKFREQYLNMSNSYTRDNLHILDKTYDLFITGSDQVWNNELVKNDSTYFLDFVSEKKKKASYAASLGMDKYDIDYFEINKRFLLQIAHISLREKSAADFYYRAYGLKVQVCLDPVFLLPAEDWRDFSKNATKKYVNSYILCFVIGTNAKCENAVNMAKQIRRMTGLPIKLFMGTYRFYKYTDLEHVKNVSPVDFVNLINNAAYITTNSFHATAFSTILHKNFFVDIDVERNQRIIDLLEMAQLCERGCSAGVVDCIDIETDWEKVDQRMSESIEESKKYLRNILVERGY